MADPKVQIKITADDKASKEIDKLGEKIKGIEKTTKSSSQSFQDSFTEMYSKIQVAKEAYSAFATTFNTVLDWGKQGAQVTQTADSFALLIQNIGATPDLLDQLREASRGTIDDMSLMSSTATLLAGTQGDLATALANSTPRLLEIAKAAQKLNPALGDTTFLYNSLALGVKRASPMILDNLGLTIKIGDANEKYAQALGKTVEQLTADEQKQALLNATLEAGQVLIDQVGGNVDSATDAYARMDAATKNLSDTLKANLAPTITNAAEAMVYLLTASEDIIETLGQHEDQVYDTTDSYDDYIKEMIRAAEAANYQVGENGALYTSYGKLVEEGYALSEAEYEIAKSSENAAVATSGWTDETYAAYRGLQTISEQSDIFIVSLDDINGRLNDVNILMQDYNDRLLFAAASAGMSAEEQIALADAMGLVNGNTQYALTKVKEYTVQLQNGKITQQEYNELVAELGQLMGALQDRDIAVRVHAQIDSALSQYTGGGFGVNSVNNPSENTVQQRAEGGPINAGTPYWVGERGPELIIPKQSGTVIPNNVVNSQTMTSQTSYNLTTNTSQSPQLTERSFRRMELMGAY
jgi:hypothetical protein